MLRGGPSTGLFFRGVLFSHRYIGRSIVAARTSAVLCNARRRLDTAVSRRATATGAQRVNAPCRANRHFPVRPPGYTGYTAPAGQQSSDTVPRRYASTAVRRHTSAVQRFSVVTPTKIIIIIITVADSEPRRLTVHLQRRIHHIHARAHSYPYGIPPVKCPSAI